MTSVDTKDSNGGDTVPETPKRLFVTAEGAKGRHLLYPVGVTFRIRQAASAKTDAEVDAIIEVMKTHAKEHGVEDIMSPESPLETVEVYEVNDVFWAWFKYEVVKSRKLDAVLKSCKDAMLKALTSSLKQEDIPSLIDDDKRYDWEKNQLDALAVISEGVIEAKGNASIKADLAAHIANGRLAAVVLKEFIERIETTRLEQEVYGAEMGDTETDLR